MVTLGALTHASMDSLVQSIRTAKLETVIELIGKVKDANALSSEGDSALVTCAAVGRLDVLTRLLHAGASPDTPCTSGMSALAAASLSGHLPIVRKLVEAGAQVDLQCGLSKSTALTHAATAGHRSVCEALLEAGADPHLQDAYGRSAIAHAESRDIEGTRQYADWSRWAKQIESRAAAIEAEPVPLRPPFAYNLKEGLAECHKQKQSTSAIWRSGAWLHQKRNPSEAVTIMSRDRPFSSTGFLQPGGLQSTEPFERHGKDGPTALLNFGLQDNALAAPTQQPLHMDALEPPSDEVVASVRLAVSNANPELFWDDVALSETGLRAGVLDAALKMREADKQAIYLKAAFPSVPTTHAGQPLYQGQQLQSYVTVPSAAATLLPVLEPPTDLSLAKMLATPKPPAAEADPQ